MAEPKLKELIAVFAAWCPEDKCEQWDNVGLLMGSAEQTVGRVLVALDASRPVIDEAIREKFDAVFTHHPLIFHPVSSLCSDTPEGENLTLLAQNGIAVYSAHTNLDKAPGGVCDALAKKLGLNDIEPMDADEDGFGLGRVGTLPKVMTSREAAGWVSKALQCPVKWLDVKNASITRMAVVGGSGGDEIDAAVKAGAQALVTGEVKHHQALQAKQIGLTVIDAGHAATERVILDEMVNRLQKAANALQWDVTIRKAENGSEPWSWLR